MKPNQSIKNTPQNILKIVLEINTPYKTYKLN